MSFLSWKKQFVVESDVFNLNDSWKVVENIVEKWGFSPSVKNQRKHPLNDKKNMIVQESIH
jgi:hypothetical protein